MQAKGIPSGMPAAMGTVCKSLTTNTYTCARDTSYNPSTNWFYYTDPITLNPFGFDSTNSYFSVYLLSLKVLFLYDQVLDIQYAYTCPTFPPSGCTPLWGYQIQSTDYLVQQTMTCTDASATGPALSQFTST